MKYKIEFERRLKRLKRAIDSYFIFGVNYDLFPSLFSLFSYVWSNSLHSSFTLKEKSNKIPPSDLSF